MDWLVEILRQAGWEIERLSEENVHLRDENLCVLNGKALLAERRKRFKAERKVKRLKKRIKSLEVGL